MVSIVAQDPVVHLIESGDPLERQKRMFDFRTELRPGSVLAAPSSRSGRLRQPFLLVNFRVWRVLMNHTALPRMGQTPCTQASSQCSKLQALVNVRLGSGH